MVAVGFAGLSSAGSSVASPPHHHRLHHPQYSGLSVGGAVAAPHTYSGLDLRAMASGRSPGRSSRDLVNASQPTLPEANALLRVTVTVGEIASGYP